MSWEHYDTLHGYQLLCQTDVNSTRSLHTAILACVCLLCPPVLSFRKVQQITSGSSSGTLDDTESWMYSMVIYKSNPDAQHAVSCRL